MDANSLNIIRILTIDNYLGRVSPQTGILVVEHGPLKWSKPSTWECRGLIYFCVRGKEYSRLCPAFVPECATANTVTFRGTSVTDGYARSRILVASLFEA